MALLVNPSPFVTKGPLHTYYKQGQLLGEGAFGATYLCTNNVSNKKYACKNIPVLRSNIQEQIRVKREVDILSSITCINHPNLISLEEVFEDESHVYIVMELCNGGSLSDRLRYEGSLTEKEAAIAIKDIMMAIEACHKVGIVHRDLKLNNVMYHTCHENSKLKLIDFGVSAYYDKIEPLCGAYGNAKYMAPEMLYGPYGPEVDIWSGGVLLCKLLIGYYPYNVEEFAEMDKFQLFQTLYVRPFQWPLFFTKFPWPNISEGAKDLVKSMLEIDVGKRLSASQVLEHPWIKQMTK